MSSGSPHLAAALLAGVLACAVAPHAHAQAARAGAYVGSGWGAGLGWPTSPADDALLHQRGQVGPPGLRRIEQGFDDLDPLRTSGMWVDGRVQLQSPLGFQDLYEGPDGRFYRVSGGITAAFDRSQYDSTRGGVVPLIPPGTVFYIGEIPSEQAWSSGGAGAQAVSMRTDNRIDTRQQTAAPRPRVFEATTGDNGATNLATNADYRRTRVESIVRRASGG